MGVRIQGDLKELNRRVRSLAQVRLDRVAANVGEALVSSTIQRFMEQKDPTGQPWQPLAAATVAPRARDFTKGGRLRKGVEERLQGRKILIQSARLRNSITSKRDGTAVAVGTNVVYAAIHQFGGMAGRGRRVRIPARPYLGVSRADQAEITRILQEELGA
ncbi:phage virion morphogenesis protein [uncultured Meiothermus sp.]|jgi:phage virion morphogenesis protein|uniref:phage virion morphogenesis protein n=1 Tax=uncultured Meiothermus sp. TaxID=157471 RepID=UPI0026220829|nr:phage virion morphogenesis protein [uncultured Meiothermus sp.]